MKPYFLTFLMALIIALANLLGRGRPADEFVAPCLRGGGCTHPTPAFDAEAFVIIKSIKELAHGN